jgi:hypothetical protein
MATKYKAPKSQKRFSTVWGELAYLCQKVHYWLHEQHRRANARHYQSRLEQVLNELPENDQAIIREEGWALLCELKQETAAAVKHRKREIQLLEKLHESVRKSVQAGDYDDKMAASILAGREEAALQKRRDILRTLEQNEARQQGDGMRTGLRGDRNGPNS